MSDVARDAVLIPLDRELQERLGWLVGLRWFAGGGLVAGAFAGLPLLSLPLPYWPLVAVGGVVLAYNAVLCAAGQALAGTLRLPEQVAQRSTKRPRFKAFSLETEIGVDNELSNQFTVIEASGLDRPGLLYDLTRTISDLNLNIASAHVSTFGERAVDVFYVTDLLGHKVTNGARQAAIRRRLSSAFDGAAQGEARPARRKEPA